MSVVCYFPGSASVYVSHVARIKADQYADLMVFVTGAIASFIVKHALKVGYC